MAAGDKPPRTIVFVAFTGEESGLIGSKHYADHPVLPMGEVRAMLNLDTVGRLGANRLSVLATGTATEWQHIFRGVSYVVGVDSRLIPESYEASDQKSFIDRGVPAVQLFTEPHGDYHRPGDTADKVDVAGLVKVATFAHETLAYLAQREEPLTVTIAASGTGAGDAPAGGGSAAGTAGSGSAAANPGAAGGRRVSLGTVPDFGFAGPGVRVSSVVAGSPAEAAGIREGDILVTLGGQTVASLKAYSDLLKGLSPGQVVEVIVMRDGAPVTLSATLAAR
jgi:aminopeptidase N